MNKRIIGEDMYTLVKKLYPINRSITGSGVRETLKMLQEQIPLAVHEVKSGTQVFDWIVPDEWNINDAYIADSQGNKIVDFKKSNLQVVNYSVPIRAKLSLVELKKHLHTLPDRPDWIPYKTSYYEKTWGFCIAYNDFKKLKDDTYTVVIDSTLKKGSLTYGEYYLPGESREEILISTHICHSSMCNDNLSGISVAVYLAKYLKSLTKRKFSYRFLFIPGTIGSLAWLYRNKDNIKNIMWGLVLTGVGDRGDFTYKRTKQGNSEIDICFEHALKASQKTHTVIDFYPYGYDERQYSSLGFNIPAATLMRSVHGTYPEYHTSGDNLDFVTSGSLGETYEVCVGVIELFEKGQFYINNFPYGEPQLGRRGIYKAMNDVSNSVKDLQMAILWILSYSDGRTSLLNIARKSGLSGSLISQAAKILSINKLISLK